MLVQAKGVKFDSIIVSHIESIFIFGILIKYKDKRKSLPWATKLIGKKMS